MEVKLARFGRELDADGLLVHPVVLGHHGNVLIVAAEQVKVVVVERFVSLGPDSIEKNSWRESWRQH